LFTHYAKTFRDLVYSLRNSLLKTGVFTNEKVAEQQVISVINFDIHLKRDVNGRRYIERITECVPLDKETDYPVPYRQTDKLEDKMAAFMDTAVEYFRRSTDRKQYEARNVIEFRDGKYVSAHPISDQMKEMQEHMPEPDRAAFAAFLEANWGECNGA
jgi:pilus assembly protein CpaF